MQLNKEENELNQHELELPTSGSSGKMLSTSLLYLGLSAPQQPQTPKEDRAREGRISNQNRFTEIHRAGCKVGHTRPG